MAKLGKHYALEAADRLVKEINKLLKELPFDLDCFNLQAYSNGREQGYHISNFIGNGCSFSQYRNSDQIVLYIGLNKDFSMQGNSPSDEIWKKAQFFEPKHIGKAASVVFDFILDELIADKSFKLADDKQALLLTSDHSKVRQLGEKLNAETNKTEHKREQASNQ